MRIRYRFRDEEHTEVLEKHRILIGRNTIIDKRLIGPPADLDLSFDRSVSRPHAAVWTDDRGRCWIEDEHSKHGTFVNGENIKGRGPITITPGVPIKIGETTLELLADEPAPEEPAIPLPPEARTDKTLPIRVKVSCLPTLNYSLVHADVPFLHEVTVVNDADKTLPNFRLQLILHGFAESEPVSIPAMPSGGSHTLTTLPRFILERHRLRDLPSEEKIALQAWADGVKVPLEPPLEVTIQPPNAWYCVGHERALAGFVMPNTNAIDEISPKARRELQRLIKDVRIFPDALESPAPDARDCILKAFYHALQDHWKIRYDYERRLSYALDWQAVRFHHQVLKEFTGTCIDLAALLAACLENVHLDPLIIIVKIREDLHHALVGCWRDGTPRRPDGTSLFGPVIRDQERFRRWVETGKVPVLDAVGFATSGDHPAGMPFEESRKKAEDLIRECPFVYALDIVAAREAGIVPMPFGRGVQYDREAWYVIHQARCVAEESQSYALCSRHLLLALLNLENGLLRRVLTKISDASVSERIARKAREKIPKSQKARHALRETSPWRKVMSRAREIAGERADLLMTEADLIRALLEKSDSAGELLRSAGCEPHRCLEMLSSLLEEDGMPSLLGSAVFRG